MVLNTLFQQLEELVRRPHLFPLDQFLEGKRCFSRKLKLVRRPDCFPLDHFLEGKHQNESWSSDSTMHHQLASATIHSWTKEVDIWSQGSRNTLGDCYSHSYLPLKWELSR